MTHICEHCGKTNSAIAPHAASTAAILFASELASELDRDEVADFLDAWCYGDFDHCRKHWPEAPDEIYIGADPSLET